MFDNGNFRRKRKRKSDTNGQLSSDKAEGNSLPDSPKNGEHLDMLESSSPGTDDSTEKRLSPPTITPCLSNFLSSMTAYNASSVSRSVPLGLSNETPDKMVQNTANFSSYSPLSNIPSHGGSDWSPTMSSSPFGYSSSLLNQFNPHFYNSITNNTLFSREGTEV